MKRILPAIIFIVIIIILWEIAVLVFNIPEYLLPPPNKIILQTINNFQILMKHTSITFLEAFFGFILGSSIGFVLAILFVHSKTLELGIYPYAIALKSVPIIAIAPLLIVWFGNGITPKIIVSATISFFPVVVNAVKGMRNIDIEAFDLFDSLSASRNQVFFKLRMPTCLPYLFSALKMSSTLAVIGAIVGEFAGSDRGLGFYIMVSSHRLETVDMFVGILTSSLLGIGFFYIIEFIELIVVPWGKSSKLNIV